MVSEEGKCPLCGGRKVPGTTTFAAELGFGVVVVRKVKALVCGQCGEEWIPPETARRFRRASLEEASNPQSPGEKPGPAGLRPVPC